MDGNHHEEVEHRTCEMVGECWGTCLEVVKILSFPHVKGMEVLGPETQGLKEMHHESNDSVIWQLSAEGLHELFQHLHLSEQPKRKVKSKLRSRN